MRLIDADALKNAIRAESWKEDTTVKMAVEYINILIDEQPTVSPDDIRAQGKWVDKPTGAYGRWQSWCSVCGKHSGIGGIESNRHKTYCPNCGAKMDGKDDE